MRRGTFVRVTIYLLPSPIISTPDLSTLTMFCITARVLEGWLCDDVEVGGRLCVAVRHWRRQPCRGRLESTEIIKISHQYVLSSIRLYQVLRVPPPVGETFN
jgi:hypothetical protein